MKNLFLLYLFAIFLSPANAQDLEWLGDLDGASDGNNTYNIYTQTTIEKDGYIYSIVTSPVNTDFDFGPGTLNFNPSLGHGFILKTGTDGTLIWGKQIAAEWGSITTDNNQNVLVTGRIGTATDIDPGPGTFIASEGIFAMKLDSSGNFLWGYSVDNNANAIGQKIVSDNAGNVIIMGRFDYTADFDPGPGVYNLVCYSTPSSDLFIVKLSSNGSFIWGKRMAYSMGYGNCYDAISDSAGNIFSTFNGPYFMNIDGVTYGNSGQNLFFVKQDSLGNYIWVKQINGGFPAAMSMTFDKDNNILSAGCFSGTTDFDPSPAIFNLSCAGLDDGFILKLDNYGNFIWVKQIAGAGEQKAHDVAIDKLDNIYVVGKFSDTVDFNPNIGVSTMISNGDVDGFITKYTLNGNLIWAKSFGGPLNDYASNVSVDTLLNLYIRGGYRGTVDFNLGASINNYVSNSWSVFISKYSQDLCSNLGLVIDSIKKVECTSMGFANGHAIGGLEPYTYQWSTSPVVNDSFASFPSAGWYQLIVSDGYSCSAATNILINGAKSVSGFDLNTNLVSTNYRTGFSSIISLDAFNDGCVPASGSLQLILDTLVIYTSAVPAPDFIYGDTLIWNFSNLTYDSIHILPQITVQTPVWAAIGDTVCFKTIISPLVGDIDTTNNIKQYCFPVINGYDPNDKKVYPVGACIPGYIENDQLLTYTVRFQNTGNASAIDVYVLDTLDVDLNLNTIRVIGNSHPLITEVLPGNVLKFRFDNINLADSTSNEAESHGYVIFEVLPNVGLSNGTAITNNVGIYFDYNPPVYTNTVLNTISDGTVNTNVNTFGNTLTADLSGVNYQWLNCDNGNSIIVGATNQSYTAVTSGNYAVIINDGCFIDTSACTLLTVIGISEVENSNQFSFYPNPSNNNITITVSEPTYIKIINMLGEVVLEKQVQNNSVIDINDLSNGIYFIQTKGGYSTKLIKN